MSNRTLDLYTQLVKAYSLVYDYLDENQEDYVLNESILEDFKREVKGDQDVSPSDMGKYFDGMSTAIYKIADKLRDNVDCLKRLSSESTKGISRSAKITIALLGETSAGKTTFLDRIYGEPCGETGPTPITAFPVVHKITESRSYLDIIFPQTFIVSIEQKEKFAKFLNKYDLTGFEIEHNEYKTTEESYRLPKGSNFINFIWEANSFPGCIKEVVWNHKKSTRHQSCVTDFADFVDMPGSGGQMQHTENIVTFLKERGRDLDLVLYLIKSDQGVPSGYENLKELKQNFSYAGIYCDLYFVFQIKNTDLFTDKVSALKKFIEVDNVDAIDGFSDEEKLFYKKSYVVDARGSKDDHQQANFAMASVIKTYFTTHCSSFCKSLNSVPRPKEDGLLSAPAKNEKGINGFIRDFLNDIDDECHDGKLAKIDDVRTKFNKTFYLNEEDLFEGDLKVTIDKLLGEINGARDEILDYLSTGDGIFDSIITKGKGGRYFDTTKYNTRFYKEYDENENWQMLAYRIQMYHWLRLTYSDNSFEKIYSNKIADPLKKELLDNIARLQKINTDDICVNLNTSDKD